jgi:hypothetical protein
MEKKVLAVLNWELNVCTPHAIWDELCHFDLCLPDLKPAIVVLGQYMSGQPNSLSIPPSAYIAKVITDSGISLSSLPFTQKWSRHLLDQK